MMDFLKSWIINIVTVMIFITFLELLLPNSNMRKYIHMIVGLLVMLVITQPLLTIASNRLNLEQEIFKVTSSMDQKSLAFDMKQFQGVQKKQIINLYKEKLKNHIREQLEYDDRIHITHMDAQIIEDQEKPDFGKVQKLTIYVAKYKENQSENRGIQPVPTISIHSNECPKSNEKVKVMMDQKELNTMSQKLAGLYGIQKENINILIDQ